MEINDNFMIGSINQIKNTEKPDNMHIDQEGFLRIMAASISNPSMSGGGEGESQTDYLGQIAQFNMLDQLGQVATTLQNTMLMTQQQQAINLVGKDVTLAGEDAQLVNGVVEKVRFSNGYATILVNGVEYGLNNLIEIGVANGE